MQGAASEPSEPARDGTELLDAGTVAGRIGCSRRFIYRLASEGTLPAYRVGRLVRFYADDVEAFVRAGRITA